MSRYLEYGYNQITPKRNPDATNAFRRAWIKPVSSLLLVYLSIKVNRVTQLHNVFRSAMMFG